MIIEVLREVAKEEGLNFSEAGNMVLGTIKSYCISIKANQKNNCYILNAWVKSESYQAPVSLSQWTEEYISSHSFLKAFNYNENTYNALLACDADRTANKNNLKEFLNSLTLYLSMNYYKNCCTDCGKTLGVRLYKNGLVTALLCDDCLNIRGFRKPQPQQPVHQPQQPTAPAYQTQANQAVPAPSASVVAGSGFIGGGVQSSVSQQPQSLNTGYVANASNNEMMASVSAYENMEYASNAPAVGTMESAPSNGGYPTNNPALNPMAGASDNTMSPPPPSNMNAGYMSGTSGVDSSASRFPSASQNPLPAYNPSGMSTPIIPKTLPSHSNPLLGFLGAVLFSLVGCALWILCSQLNFISYLAALVLGYGAVKGYVKFGKRFDIFGVIICIVVLLLAVYACDRFSLGLSIMNEFNGNATYVQFAGQTDLWTAITNFDSYVKIEPKIADAFYHDLIIGYVFTFIGFIIVAIEQRKKGI